jgi:PD-(D/E)XK nuclease superfamily protein
MKFEYIEESARPLKPIPHKKDLSHKANGERSEAVILAKLVELGYHVLIPDGDNLRYDLLIEDIDEHFWRIQCKTGWTKSNGESIHFLTASSYAHTRTGQAGQRFKDYQGQIDFFAVYCSQTKGTYLVPVEHFSGNHGQLYLTKVTNSRKREIRWAKDYEI